MWILRIRDPTVIAGQCLLGFCVVPMGLGKATPEQKIPKARAAGGGREEWRLHLRRHPLILGAVWGEGPSL